MLEPSQFEVNEAWIVFRLNDAPISTEVDGDFNVYCLMDAASCYILGNEFVSVQFEGVPTVALERLVQIGRAEAQVLCTKLFLLEEIASVDITALLRQHGIEVTSVPAEGLKAFISEAQEGYRAHASGGRVQ